MSHCNEMICQPVTLSGYAEWPKVADPVIEADKRIHPERLPEWFPSVFSSVIVNLDDDNPRQTKQYKQSKKNIEVVHCVNVLIREARYAP
jgi:hypothetical protein